jgi:hypothetical protein
MKKAWGIISKKYPHINTYGCVAHGLNLLIKDIINLDSFKEIIEDSKEVINTIRRGYITKAIFEKKKKRSKQCELYGTCVTSCDQMGLSCNFF